MALITGLFTMFFWGIAIFLAAIVSRKIGNILTLFWMQVFGFVVGTAYFLFSLSSFSFSAVLNFLPILVVIALLQVIAYLAFYKGLVKGKVSLVSPLGASWSLITAILSIIFFKEALKTSQLIAIILIVFGIVTISINFKDLLLSRSFKLLTGVKEGIISLLGWGISLFLLIFVTKEMGWFMPAFIFRFLILLALSVYILFSGKSFVTKADKMPWGTLLLIGLFDICAFFTYSLGVSVSYGSIVAPISSANTLITIALGVILLKEKVQPRQILGISSIVIGLILISV